MRWYKLTRWSGLHSGWTDLAKNWVSSSGPTKCHHSISYAGRRNVYVRHFIPATGLVLVCLRDTTKQELALLVVKNSTWCLLSDVFSAWCLQTVEFFLYCSFAIFIFIRDLQPPVWLYSSLSYLPMKPEGCETTLLTEFFLVLDEGITLKTKVRGKNSHEQLTWKTWTWMHKICADTYLWLFLGRCMLNPSCLEVNICCIPASTVPDKTQVK